MKNSGRSIVMDFDDLCDVNDKFDILCKMRDRDEGFKVTLFAIPTEVCNYIAMIEIAGLHQYIAK